MTKSAELWEKYQYEGWVGPTAFKAALAEYGAAVRALDVEICNQTAKRSERDMHGSVRCAAAIAREPLE